MEDEPITASDYYHRGLELLQRGEPERALECVNTAIARNYFGADIALIKGEILLELGKHQEALEWFDRTVHLDQSKQNEVLLWRGRVFFELRQFGRALSALNRVIAQSAAPADAYFTKGMVLIERGDPMKAMEALAECKALIGDSPERLPDILYAEARALDKLGRGEEAVACLERIISLDGDYVEAYAELGELYRGMGRLDQACEVYRRGLADHPGDASLCNDYGNALRDLGRLQESLAYLDRAVEGDRSKSMALFNRAITHERMGHWQEALADYQAVIDANPKDSETRLRRVDIFSRLDRFQEAYAEYSLTAEEDRKTPDAQDKLARLLNRHARTLEVQGEIAAALVIYRQLLDMHPELIEFDNAGKQFASAQARQTRILELFTLIPPDHRDAELLPLLRAILYLRLNMRDELKLELPRALKGPYPDLAEVLAADSLFHDHNDADGALSAIDRALERRPDFIKALWLRVAVLLQGKQDVSGALGTYNRMLQLSPGNPMVLEEMGSLYLNTGEPLRALLCYRALQEGNPGDIAVQREIALCYLGLGRVPEAVEELRRLAYSLDTDLFSKLFLVEALLRAGEENEAADLLSEVEHVNAGLDPSVTDSCRELRGAMLNRQGQHAASVEVLSSVPEEELSQLGLLELGIAQARLGRVSEAATLLEQMVLDSAPESHEGQRARIELAKAEREIGNRERALQLVRETLAAFPYNEKARAMESWLFRELGEVEQAESSEAQGRLYRELRFGHRHLYHEEFADAADAIRTVVKDHPEFAEAQYLFGASLCRIGQFVASADALRRAVAADPRYLERAKRDPMFDGFAFSELAEEELTDVE